MTPPFLTLSQLNSLVAHVFRDELAMPYWVTAEISELHGSHSGHLYLELVEMAKTRQVVAKARATIWANAAQALQGKFFAATQQTLQRGMKVLLLVRLSFHEIYGYALHVQDIDPAYTIGDQAQRRKEIIAQLEEDGIIHLNKELALPCPLRRIAVISSATAAGYGDFCHQLEQAGFRFETKLFPATMQGEQTEKSVLTALETIYAEAEEWDVVVIIRGGGATSDLSSFDTYLLAAAVAQFPLPVFTGIGHERDETLLDIVAHRYFKTPTAVAAFLIEGRRDQREELKALEGRLWQGIAALLREKKRCLEEVAQRYLLFGQSYVSREKEEILLLSVSLQRAVQTELQEQQKRVELLPLRLSQILSRKLVEEWQQLELYQKAISLASPDRILKMGYSITMKEGEVVTTAAQLKKGDRVAVRWIDGEVEALVQ